MVIYNNLRTGDMEIEHKIACVGVNFVQHGKLLHIEDFNLTHSLKIDVYMDAILSTKLVKNI